MTTRKQTRARGQPGGLSFRETWARCPYRSFLGIGTNADADADKMMRRVGCAIAVLGEEARALA